MTDLGDVYGLLDECERRGVVLAGGRLTLDGPRGALTPDLVDRLRASEFGWRNGAVVFELPIEPSVVRGRAGGRHGRGAQ